MSSNDSSGPAESQAQVSGLSVAPTAVSSGNHAHESETVNSVSALPSQIAASVEPSPPAAAVEAAAGAPSHAEPAEPAGREASSADEPAAGIPNPISAAQLNGASSSSSASSHGRGSAAAAPAAPQHPKLAFLESLSPADALRYKALAAAKPPLDMCLHMLGEGLPLMEEAEREDLAIALSAAAKAFAVQMCEAAIDVRDAAGDAPDGVVRERHMLEAYGRVLRRGLIPGTPEWSATAEAAAMAGATSADMSEDAGAAAGAAGSAPGDVFEALLFGTAAATTAAEAEGEGAGEAARAGK